MKTLPVYENLNTSFVNLSALIRHLRSRNLSGQAVVKLHGYQAKITFDAENPPVIEEHDEIAGRIAEGDEALQRLLIRAREPGGTISVFEFVKNAEIIERETVNQEITKQEIPPVAPIAESVFEKELIPFAAVSNGRGKPIVKESRGDFLNLVPENHSPLPLEFTNRVENRARRMQISAEEWQTLLQLVGELFGAVENVLETENVNFSSLLDTARAEISGDYPFLNPSSGKFYYASGTAEISEPVSAKLFAASINEVLRRILGKLAGDAQFSAAHRDAVQKILALAHHRQSLYDKFFITPQLNRILGT